MLFANLRASAWRIAAAVFGVLAVALLIWGLFLRVGMADAVARADAESARAQALQAELQAVNEARARDDVAAQATSVAQRATESWKADNAARSAKVKGYAIRPGDACAADADLLRELAEGRNRISAAEDRLRGE